MVNSAIIPQQNLVLGKSVALCSLCHRSCGHNWNYHCLTDGQLMTRKVPRLETLAELVAFVNRHHGTARTVRTQFASLGLTTVERTASVISSASSTRIAAEKYLQ